MLKKWFGKKDDDSKPKDAPEPESADEGEDDAAGAAESADAADSSAVEDGGDASEEPKKSRWSFLTGGFKKTRERLKGLFGLKGKIDEETLDDIEAALYGADFGPTMVDELVDGENGVRAAWKRGDIDQQEEIVDYLKGRLKASLREKENSLARATEGPTVYLVAGVNGSGKTTSIAKLSRRLLDEGHSVLLVAADTFRAAAVEQLTIWSSRLGIDVVRGEAKQDPASVAFKGVEQGLERGIDYVIVDTAGRLQTQVNLMRELEKIRRVLQKKIPEAPHEALLVLDGTNGQNAIQQAEAFKREIEVTGIILTKLDGTAKGGVVFAIHEALDIPVKLVGVGEKVNDLASFDPDRFVDALFEETGER